VEGFVVRVDWVEVLGEGFSSFMK